MVIGGPLFHKPVRAASFPNFLRLAINKAVRFAMEPPLVNKPCAFLLYPISSPIHRMTSFSKSVPPGADRQHVTFAFSAEATRSAYAPMAVAGDATYPKNRG